MPLRIACESCGSRINVPDSLAGRKIKCPKCGSSVRAVNTTITTAASPPPPPRPRPARAETEETREEERPKKKKKKKRPKARQESAVPSWVWWIGGVVGFFAVAVFVILLAWKSGVKQEAVVYGVALLVMLPISTVILIFSMVLSSTIAGGIEFGEIHVVVPKALALLLAVNLISLLPLGVFLALPIWLFGLMYLFKLDLWETRFLFAINWGLNYLVRIFLVAIILSAPHHDGIDDDLDEAPMPVAPVFAP